MEVKLCLEHRFSDGLKHFQLAGNQLQMKHTLEDRQRKELTIMLTEAGTWCGKWSDRQLTARIIAE